MTGNPQQHRRDLARAVSEQMTALIRQVAPPKDQACEWQAMIDMDTNRSVWFSKHLFDEFQRSRFSDGGEP